VQWAKWLFFEKIHILVLALVLLILYYIRSEDQLKAPNLSGQSLIDTEQY
jgi:hypothetical protein